MRILVTGGGGVERQALITALMAAGHALFSAEDRRALMPILQQRAPEVALVLADSHAEPPADLLSLVRHTATPSPYILLLSSDPSEAFLQKAYECGIDGDMRSSSSAAYVNARVEAVRRRAETGRKPPPCPTVTPVTAGSRASLGGALDLMSRTAAWQSARENLKYAAGLFLTLPVCVLEAPPCDPKLDLACSIQMSNVAQELELCITVGADGPGSRSLAAHMFGPEGDDLAGDLLSEMANIFMGTMKSALGAESLAFSSGVPTLLNPDVALRPTTTYRLQDAFALDIEGARVVVHLGVASRAKVKVTPMGLLEGMVLAGDVFNPKGALMVGEGTRLSLNMVERLRGMLPPKHPIEVMA